mgnify:CR=1 FL=1
MTRKATLNLVSMLPFTNHDQDKKEFEGVKWQIKLP